MLCCSSWIYALILLQFRIVSSSGHDGLEVYRMSDFPKAQVALHMPCKESNMFATKCMCHIICTDPGCNNAKDICVKYQSKGCKYVLLRNVANKRIATLKRKPTEDEYRRFDPSFYRSSSTPVMQSNQLSSRKRKPLSELVEMTGSRGKDLIQGLAEIPTTKFCGIKSSNATAIVSAYAVPTAWTDNGISLFAVNYRAPMTLLNSLRTWNSSGLLDYVDEKIMILNDPHNEEIAMSIDHGFRVMQPKEMPRAKVRKENVLTIGAAFYEAIARARNEYVLFLENDFKIDTAMTRSEIILELVAAAGMLNQGIEVIRLQSRKYKGCGTHKDCDHSGIHLNADNVLERTRNWFAFYCQGHPGTESFVSDCLKSPLYRCFTSRDSNWSLNAVLVKRSSILSKQYPTADGMKTIAEIALESYLQQDAFETAMMYTIKWMNWQVPICISYQGLFVHEEIETGS